VVKSVKVHDDTHRVLKQMKVQKRSKSVDEVIRDMIKQTTGQPVEKTPVKQKAAELTAYLSE
jgi:predicted CopG family antitoxin